MYKYIYIIYTYYEIKYLPITRNNKEQEKILIKYYLYITIPVRICRGAQIRENKSPKNRTFFGNFWRFLSSPEFTLGSLFSMWGF